MLFPRSQGKPRRNDPNARDDEGNADAKYAGRVRVGHGARLPLVSDAVGRERMRLGDGQQVRDVAVTRRIVDMRRMMWHRRKGERLPLSLTHLDPTVG